MSLLDQFLFPATVAAVEPVAPRMRRIRLTGESLRGLDWKPGQHIRVRVDTLSLRSYSIWDYVDGEYLDLGVLDHPGAGPGARWSRQARAGQPVTFTRPQGRLVLRDGAPRDRAGVAPPRGRRQTVLGPGPARPRLTGQPQLTGRPQLTDCPDQRGGRDGPSGRPASTSGQAEVMRSMTGCSG